MKTTQALDGLDDAVFYGQIEKEERDILDKQAGSDSSDTQPDTDAEPYGAGPTGKGPKLMVGSFERRRPLCDGAGLCSLGLWAPADRPPVRSERLLAIRRLVMDATCGLKEWIGMTAEELFWAMARGETRSNPLTRELCDHLYRGALDIFSDKREDARPRKDDRSVAMHVRLLGGHPAGRQGP